LKTELVKSIAKMHKPNVDVLLEELRLFQRMPASKVGARPTVNNVYASEDGKGKGKRGSGPRKCPLGCSDSHPIWSCNVYKNKSASSKLQMIKEANRCVNCLRGGHSVENCDKDWTCKVDECGAKHNMSLHSALAGTKHAVNLTKTHEGPAGYLGMQIIPVKKHEAVTLWDNGSNTNLVTSKFVSKAKLKLDHRSLQIDIPGSKMMSNRMCSIPLTDSNGNVDVVTAAVVDTISQDVHGYPAADASKVFGDDKVFDDISGEDLDLLLGMNNTAIFPKEVYRKNNSYLYRSLFGTGFFACGIDRDLEMDSRAMLVKGSCFLLKSVNDFWEGENLGIAPPRRCDPCIKCTTCSSRNEQMTWQENKELKMIEEGLTYLPNEERWVAQYPVIGELKDLPDNYNLAVKVNKALKQRLVKTGKLEEFDREFRSQVDRGVFKKLDKSDMKYEGPVNYIAMTETLKNAADTTTPVRTCMNSSLKMCGVSLNDLLAKGPSALNCQLEVLIRFRGYTEAIALDIKKFYNSVSSVERDQQLRRVLWNGDPDGDPEIYLTAKVNFGDRPAGCVAATALAATADMFKDIDVSAADKLKNDTYVDDFLSGDDSKEALIKLEANSRKICLKGGFEFKPSVKSGDKADPMKVLGVLWESEQDLLSVACKVNLSAKRKGINVEQDLDLNTLLDSLPMVLTRRVIWRVAMMQYDPLGLLCPITIQLKQVMRSLAGGMSSKKDWDLPVGEAIADKFRVAASKLKAAREIRFPRSLTPADKVGRPRLVTFTDGSQTAYCCLVYVLWRTPDQVFSTLVAGKAKVMSQNQVSVPRMELMGNQMGCRLAAKVKKSLKWDFEKEYYFTDSMACLGMIQADSGSLATFGGNRVGEIKTLTDPDDWWWVPTDQQVADIGTRENAMPADLDIGSRYQMGPGWLALQEEEWPMRKVVGQVPKEELSTAAKKVMMVNADPADFFRYKKFDSFKRAVRSLATVLEAVERFKLKVGKVKSVSSRAGLQEIATNLLFNWSQVEERQQLQDGKYGALAAKVYSVSGFGSTVEVVGMTGRTPEALRVGYDSTWLPLLDGKNRLAAMIIRDAHWIQHGGQCQTLQASRKVAWITNGGKVAKSVNWKCQTCKLERGRRCLQRMAPLPAARFLPAPPFHSASIDLFGPLLLKNFVKSKSTKSTSSTRKAWGLMIVCQATSAVAIEIIHDYSMDGFLLAFRRFCARYGNPVALVSDQGTQLVAAAKEIKTWDWEAFGAALDEKFQISWKFVPVDAPWMNGQSERHIGLAKKLLTRQLGGSKATAMEMITIFAEVEAILNSKPYVSALTDPSVGEPLTPQHLLGPRASRYSPGIALDGRTNLKKRFLFVQDCVDNFWRKYQLLVFPSKIPFGKWTVEQANLNVGDVVQVLEGNAVGKVWVLATVKEVVEDSDGKVRKVFVQRLGLKGVQEVPVHRLRVIVRRLEDSGDPAGLNEEDDTKMKI
jgi:hypothetical protein